MKQLFLFMTYSECLKDYFHQATSLCLECAYKEPTECIRACDDVFLDARIDLYQHIDQLTLWVALKYPDLDDLELIELISNYFEHERE